MIACVQRVSSAEVNVDKEIKGAIGQGLLVLFGVKKGDDTVKAKILAEKICNLRIFPNSDGKMSLSIKDTGGEILIISQFTLTAETNKGNRPDFINAAPPPIAEKLYIEYIDYTKAIIGAERVSHGVFAAHMQVSLVNDGPVTILMER